MVTCVARFVSGDGGFAGERANGVDADVVEWTVVSSFVAFVYVNAASRYVNVALFGFCIYQTILD